MFGSTGDLIEDHGVDGTSEGFGCLFSSEAVEKRICRVWRADLHSQIAAGLRADPGTPTRIVCSSGPTPMIAITRLML
jgi:hypothetical protein